MVAWKSALPLLFAAALIIFEERVSVPSCKIVSVDRNDSSKIQKNGEDLKVMMVADLLLTGSEAGYTSLYFRDSYMAKFLRKSFERVKPDMLVVLGDVSAKGSELTNIKWISVLQQFQRMLDPFLGLPLHIVLGDRDVGDCSKINSKSVHRMANSLPGLDSAGCGAFEVSNISFISLNAVAMLCSSNDLRFSVETVIERESLDLRNHAKETTDVLSEPVKWRDDFENFHWRENPMASSSGPVLLLHFPLHRTSRICEGTNFPTTNLGQSHHESSRKPEHRGFVGAGPYEFFHTVPPNVTEYIFQALRPRIVFSAHTHHFCEHIHQDGTREVTVPAMTWFARDDPGFVVVTFGPDHSMTVSQCSLARESHVLMAYASVLVLLVSTILIASRSRMLVWANDLRHLTLPHGGYRGS
ncbi:uncharacterized protein LOC131233026 isoform X1 [Magnolia sinica]|uniref:uncharacterized protein LOC131233026 isoform X1 n=1 Tax=Magnolia sinica TaxID=86752 RepID=UPI0026598C4E|nr:uncharacterized protein LOC131233026 isoform X1 [Magnolia sinica]